MVLLVITIIRRNKMEADRKEREKKWFTKHFSEIQNQEDFELTPLHNHMLQRITKRTLNNKQQTGTHYQATGRKKIGLWMRG